MQKLKKLVKQNRVSNNSNQLLLYQKSQSSQILSLKKGSLECTNTFYGLKHTQTCIN